ncbi:RDD family protein [Bdellovibrio sp. HCB337]|uniref:RDD family protein n=1 Tax=Bdellovibrio sp. HCB337 TaxID=3394358 RepID=UPI0039A60E79
MDPFEEFEFKPLTEGLGFHKKKASNPKTTDLDSSFEVTKPGLSLNQTGLSLLEDEAVDPLRPPLPRKSQTPAIEPEASPSSSAVDEILKTLQKNRRLDFENKSAAKAATKPVAAPKVEEYKADVWNVSSALLDSMLVIAASLLCMIIVLMVTKADLIANLSNPDESGMIYLSTFALLASVSLIYLLVNRMFLGSTPGEWAFEQRIGQPEEINTAMYSVRVLARSLVVIATGFIVLPILSALLNRDLAGEITGARLVKKV